MARSAAEINAEAERLRQEAEVLVAATHVRLDVAQQIVANAEATAQAARDSAGQAAAATAANDIVAAEGRCTAARTQLATARASAAQAFAGVAGGDPKEEWKECRASIDRFDKLLVDLRKTGFGFITTLVGATALLIGTATSAPAAELKFSAFAIIALLIITLFIVDPTHQIWLSTSAKRAIELELGLNYRITQDINRRFRSVDAFVIGILLYLVLFGTTSCIFWVALEGSSDYQRWTLYGGVAGVVMIVAIAIVTHFRGR